MKQCFSILFVDEKTVVETVVETVQKKALLVGRGIVQNHQNNGQHQNSSLHLHHYQFRAPKFCHDLLHALMFPNITFNRVFHLI